MAVRTVQEVVLKRQACENNKKKNEYYKSPELVENPYSHVVRPSTSDRNLDIPFHD